MHNTSLYGVFRCLNVDNEDTARSNATSNQTYFGPSKVCLSHPLVCLDFHNYPRNENRREKVKSNENLNAADGPLAAADKALPINVGFRWHATPPFRGGVQQWKSDELFRCKLTNRGCEPFSKSGFGVIRV